MSFGSEIAAECARQAGCLLLTVVLVVAAITGGTAFVCGYYAGQQESEATHD